jgi:hypothetical protein
VETIEPLQRLPSSPLQSAGLMDHAASLPPGDRESCFPPARPSRVQ